MLHPFQTDTYLPDMKQYMYDNIREVIVLEDVFKQTATDRGSSYHHVMLFSPRRSW